MNFTAIDFETAHAEFPCEIGLTQVTNGVITKSGSWLIKPACFFDEIWSELQPWFEDQYLVAHNAAFDMRVLRATLAHYDLAIPHAEYFCSVSMSRKTWKELPSHSLGVVSQFHNIRFNHHRAGDDASACAQIALKAFETVDAQTVQEGLKKLGVALKKL